jgi:uncharacterized damage-inducible protein DinB
MYIPMTSAKQPEPWLRGTQSEVPAVHRAVLHALELAEEDLHRWCEELTTEEWNARPGGVAPVAFHVRHVARSIDRLLTYAEGRQMDEAQMAELKCELRAGAVPEEVLAEMRAAFERAAQRVRALAGANLEQPRSVGRQALPTTLGGLLVHVAEHTQRHVGQAVTTAKLIQAGRGE